MIIVWPILAVSSKKYDTNLAWAIPLSLVCVSVRWWENFLEEPVKRKKGDSEDNRTSVYRLLFVKNVHETLWRVAGDIQKSRIRNDLILSLWKITLTFCLMIGMIGLELDDWDAVFSLDTR